MTGVHKHLILKWLAIVAAVLIAALLIALRMLFTHAEPYLRARATDMLSSRFHSDAEIHELHVSLFPLVLQGKGIVLYYHGHHDLPPLITIDQFQATADLIEFFGRPWHIHEVYLKGFAINVPPKEERQGQGFFGNGKAKRDIKVKIDEINAENSLLQIMPSDPKKSAHEFVIEHLVMRRIAPGKPAAFDAVLTNPTPPGQIHSTGQFGPWEPDDPRGTRVSAGYTFTNADLSVFKGISGILSSSGKYSGPLERIEVEGQTETPDFAVDTGNHPMMLKTEFHATVDGTNGETFLHPVTAHFLDSTLVCSGKIVKAPTGKGREVLLHVDSQDARIEDLLRLTVKSDKPLLDGSVKLDTSFDLPPGGGKVMDRLALNGKLAMSDMQFTNTEVRDKLENLSRRAQGHPNDQNAGSSVSQLTGNFDLHSGAIELRDLNFSLPGADVQLEGNYGLGSEKMDFHGDLRLEAKPSQMVTGVKSLLLKPFDPLFRKNGMTQVPIKVTGDRSHPSFGLDFHRKKEKEEGGSNAEENEKEAGRNEPGKDQSGSDPR